MQSAQTQIEVSPVHVKPVTLATVHHALMWTSVLKANITVIQRRAVGTQKAASRALVLLDSEVEKNLRLLIHSL